MTKEPTSAEPPTSARRRWWSLDPLGVALGAVVLAASLTPSLVPRPAVLQGVLAGLGFGIGYALGVGLSAIGRRAIAWRPRRGVRRVLRIVVAAVLAVILVAGAVGGVASQNEVRRMVEMPPLGGVNVAGLVVAFVITVLICLAIGRGLARTTRRAWQRSLARGRTPRQAALRALAWSAATALIAIIVLALVVGVLADRRHFGINGEPEPDLSAPTASEVSGGPGSAVRFEDLGRQGANFVSRGPTAEQIEELTGVPAITPVRVYVGLQTGGTLEERAALAVSELERTGGFDRSILVVAGTTGTGWLEPQSVDSLEYLHAGDTAIVALQFGYTPSWVSSLFEPGRAEETSRVLFDAVRAHWLTLPEDERPQLVVNGLSLGAQATMGAFSDADDLLTRTQGALLVGSPNTVPMWRALQEARDPGSPAWLPVLDDGARVRWASVGTDFLRPSAPWSAPRLAILQHATDPITWLGPELIWASPDWLRDDQRAPDVSPAMRWIPLVTAIQVVLDTFVSVDVPARHGHNFGDVYLDGWRAVTGDGPLDEAALARVQAEIESYAQIRPVNA